VPDPGDELVDRERLAERGEEAGAAGILAVEDELVGVGPGVAVAARVVARDEEGVRRRESGFGCIAEAGSP